MKDIRPILQPDTSLADLQKAADRARKAYENETAIAFYTEALTRLRAAPEPDPVLEYDLLAGRRECLSKVDDHTEEADLADMARLAQEMGDLTRQTEVMRQQVRLMTQLGQAADAQRLAEAFLAHAQQAGNKAAIATGLNGLGWAHYCLSDYARTQECYEEALRLHRQVGDQVGEANDLQNLGSIATRTGKTDQALYYLEAALALYRELGDRLCEAHVLYDLAQATSDYAQRRAHYKDALTVYQAIGSRKMQAATYAGLGLTYWRLGLYRQAHEYGEQAVGIARSLQSTLLLAHFLGGLGQSYLGLSNYDRAQKLFEENRILAHDIGLRSEEAYCWLGLGQVALARGRQAEAGEQFRTAAGLLGEIGMPADQAAALAWQGAAYLALDDRSAALRCTADAIRLLEEAGNAGREYPPQEVWWWRYRVLTADFESPPNDQAWKCLDQARETMMAGIATLSDEGLRRNYLNKVPINRAIVEEWTRQAARRDIAPPPEGIAGPPVGGPERLQEQLRRMLATSAHMNERRETQALLDFIIERVVELCGAERAFLALRGEEGEWDIAVTRGLEPGEEIVLKAQVEDSVLEAAALSRQAALEQDVPDLEPQQADAPAALRLRSVLGIPLASGARLDEVLYADNRVINGRFTQADVDLLNLLATQASTALDNTRLFQEISQANRELEQRVAERTAELNERVMEVEELNQDLQTANRNLEQTAGKLQEVNQELASFAYVVSHDLKAPLRAITQLANWISDDYADTLDADGQEMLVLLIRRTRRMHSLIEGILQYSRIGRVKEEEQDVDLNQLVQETVEALSPPEHIHVTIGALPTVTGEPTRLIQLFQNLLSNAIKFMDKPQGRVSVDCVEQEPHWLFSVADNGPGIEEEHHAKIFQIFQTLTPCDDVESTGIGLALVKKIVETRGGKTWVESMPGQGSTFFFTWPRRG